MTFYVENETENTFPFDVEKLVSLVGEAVLDMEDCPYEAEVNVLITDKEGIQEYNREYRGIDRETDVLSFPNIPFEKEAAFDIVEENEADYFQPDTGELILGDIILCADRIYSQAENYGHSVKREFAFLVAHSMLHLCGYDHEISEEAKVMEAKQNQVLDGLHITRECTDERDT
ncbi:MAG: rRNA maturation RNase YbeY [Lachnospiraceae bacterium]|nr:rRNA maturation RNase YbeY [Lachnospiraceae bacterium]